ncbi:MAG: hypothetical protein NTY08_12775 [Proteobacteria bacterium]|nr:hypothetical protein [Pseudomonadota bacterium]
MGSKKTKKSAESKAASSHVDKSDAVVKNKKRSDGSLAFRALQVYIKLLKTGSRLRINSFDEEWGSRRRFLDIRKVIDDASERVLGYPGLEYQDEDGRPAKAHNRVYFRLAVPDLAPPHPRNFTVFPLLMELLSPLAETTVFHQFQTVYDSNTASLSPQEKQNFERQRKKFMNLVEPERSAKQCSEIVDDVFEALTREQTLTVTWPKSAGVVSPDETLFPLKLILHHGELHLAASRRPPETGMEDIVIFPLSTLAAAKWDKSCNFIVPLGLKIDHLVRAHFAKFVSK